MMLFKKTELGGAFDAELLPSVLLPVLGEQNGSYKSIETSSDGIRIKGADPALRSAVLAALQAHVALGPAAWDAIKVSKQADPDSYDPVIKALALVMLLYHNHLRSWMRDFESEVAAATSLGDLKARMANLPDVPHVPKSTLKQDVEAILAPA